MDLAKTYLHLIKKTMCDENREVCDEKPQCVWLKTKGCRNKDGRAHKMYPELEINPASGSGRSAHGKTNTSRSGSGRSAHGKTKRIADQKINTLTEKLVKLNQDFHEHELKTKKARRDDNVVAQILEQYKKLIAFRNDGIKKGVRNNFPDIYEECVTKEPKSQNSDPSPTKTPEDRRIKTLQGGIKVVKTHILLLDVERIAWESNTENEFLSELQENVECIKRRTHEEIGIVPQDAKTRKEIEKQHNRLFNLQRRRPADDFEKYLKKTVECVKSQLNTGLGGVSFEDK